MSPEVTWIDEHLLTVGGVRFDCSLHRPDAGPEDAVTVLKNRTMIDAYVRLIGELAPKRIVELGIHRGGGAAFVHQLAAPEKLVAVELWADPPKMLTRYLQQHGAADVIRPYYGVDQADRARLGEIMDLEFGAARLDLVIDDASHQYEPTLASFEELFPRLRPGGRYVIEDWVAGYLHLNRWAAGLEAVLSEEELTSLAARRAAGELEPTAPLLSLLTVELVLARAGEGGAVESVAVDRHWTVVTRGPDPLEPGRFRLRDHYRDHMQLVDRIHPHR